MTFLSFSFSVLFYIIVLLMKSIVYTNGMDGWMDGKRNDEEQRYPLMTLFYMETIINE